MNITFNANNGLCPQYDYKDTRFLIIDAREGSGFVYHLAKKDLKVEVLHFDTHKEAYDYIKNKLNKLHDYGNNYEERFLFCDKYKDYVVEKNTLTIRNVPVRLTQDYENYHDCLRDSKKIVSEIIKKLESEQLKIK